MALIRHNWKSCPVLKMLQIGICDFEILYMNYKVTKYVTAF